MPIAYLRCVLLRIIKIVPHIDSLRSKRYECRSTCPDQTILSQLIITQEHIKIKQKRPRKRNCNVIRCHYISITQIKQRLKYVIGPITLMLFMPLVWYTQLISHHHYDLIMIVSTLSLSLSLPNSIITEYHRIFSIYMYHVRFLPLLIFHSMPYTLLTKHFHHRSDIIIIINAIRFLRIRKYSQSYFFAFSAIESVSCVVCYSVCFRSQCQFVYRFYCGSSSA